MEINKIYKSKKKIYKSKMKIYKFYKLTKILQQSKNMRIFVTKI